MLIATDHSQFRNVLENVEHICRQRLTPIALSRSNVIEIANASRSKIIRKEAKLLTLLSDAQLHPFYFIINKN
ncbi:hypothetical protein [Gynurincola endophyticus]|jgi:hypothetical protein|uniref:hypothetical protein n=1 Tax=Gynurincola endophyticus TaxID=2479004 RepID=UPI000F8CF823|nr:hypothetical protein [Gynurincola endophyticus]